MRYLGGKDRTATDLARFVLSVRGPRQCYIEPFVGGGAVFQRLAPHFPTAVAADASPDLILFWQAVAAGWAPPMELSSEERRSLKDAEPSALRAFAGYFMSFGGDWFCGYVMDSKGRPDDYMGAAHRGIEKRRPAFMGASAILQADYRDLSSAMVPGVVAYCDPPYAGTASYGAVGEFDSKEFWKVMREWVHRGALVLVSEYVAPADWTSVWEKPRKQGMRDSDGAQRDVTERLFALT